MSYVQTLRRTVAAANAGNASLAKTHLQKAAEEAPEDAGVWLWMGWFADSPLNAIHCLELALDDPRYREIAQTGLAWARAMSTFKVIEESLVEASASTAAVAPVIAASVAAQPDVVCVEPTVVIEEPSLDVEEALVAEVAKVADEVASSVGVAEPEHVEPAVEELVAVNVEAEASDWDTPVVAEQPAAPVSVEVATVTPLIEEAVVVVEPTVATVDIEAPKPVERPAAQDWFSPSRAFPSGTTRASLWGELGGSHDMLATQPLSHEPTSLVPPPVPHEPVVAAPASNDSWTDSWSTAAPETAAPLVTNTVIEPNPQPRTVIAEPAPLSAWDSTIETVTAPVSTVTAPAIETAFVVEDHSTNEPVAVPLKVAEPQPAVWRAAKTDWFGVEAEARPQDAPMPAATSRLADSIFDAGPTHVAEVAAPSTEVFPEHAPSANSHVLEHVGDVETHADTTSHGDFIEEQLAEDVFEPDDVVETTTAPVVVESAPVSPTSDVKRPTAPVESKAKRTVLVVDDSPTVRKLVSMTLEKRGFTVVAAFDGVAAIKEIATHNPDLILMDVTMPRLDGYQLCKLVKKHEATRHIPVIMLSGKDGMFDRLRGRLVGCSGYISKPFVPEALVETVEETLAQAAVK